MRTRSRGRAPTSSRSRSRRAQQPGIAEPAHPRVPAPMCSTAAGFRHHDGRRVSRVGLLAPRGCAARGGLPALRAVGHRPQVRRRHARPRHRRPRPRERPGHDGDRESRARHVGAAGHRRRRDRDPDDGRERLRDLPVDGRGVHRLQRVSITEENPALVPPGFVDDPSATSCVVRSPNSPDDRPLPVIKTANGFSATVTHQSIATCTMVNRGPPAPAIDIQKETNGSHADAPPGPFVPPATRSRGRIS